MRFTITVKTATATHCYSAISPSSFDAWIDAFTEFGMSKISVRPV